MAFPPPDQVEDQTDEDFFDKLVGDDDLGVTGSRSLPTDMVRAVSSLSIEDAGESLEESGDGGSILGDEDHKQNSVPSASEDSEKVVATEPMVGTANEIETPVPSIEKSGGSKVKEVQWSAFNADLQQSDSGGFGLFSDFLEESSDGPAEFLQNDSNSVFTEKPNADSTGDTTSSGQQEGQFYNSSHEQVADTNDLQYWENLYPGWKYGVSTGQCGMDGQQGFHARNIQVAGDGFVVNQRSDISYLQASKSAVETIAEDSTMARCSVESSFSGERRIPI
ncbi:hypothetical protein J5N97_018478 [Dioscorea zingiberensis]|uniref:Uncharacterized protein n=1 Tax=Dioscorea zingiberensis TaxID=325984 RepID=A0A9D5HBI6_9LILI|nr:hypothetical protein J5N97_018478 [Dioscorea zingiberensis]